MTRFDHALVWFRRDLRTFDHAALSAACCNARQVYCLFVLDTDILDQLDERADRRVEFILESLRELRGRLEQMGGGLIIAHGRAEEEVPGWAERLDVSGVYANRDYEPAARQRDTAVASRLAATGRVLHLFKDQVIFEADEIVTGAGKPYTVFTPYKNNWLKRLTERDTAECVLQPEHLARPPATRFMELADLGFRKTNLSELNLPPGMSGGRRLFTEFQQQIDHYHERRDYPAINGVSCLSTHLRFGTVSIRELVAYARRRLSPGADTWLSELIWREFFFMILSQFPHVAHNAFRPGARNMVWPNPPGHLEAWQAGATGYPIIDAAMRQLNQTGYMHNRLRMITASFLVKDLHVDWRLGEAWFARQLMDYDLAANNGGWQWCASTGCDAQPWFRIFNPVSQSEKFDPDGRFIRHYLPELAACPDRYLHAPWTIPPSTALAAGFAPGKDYPVPIVDHATARQQALSLFKNRMKR